ncbi:hypothetical protein [Microbulbifer sp. GL-2]|uniref:hypothetical protein n=1 Tax=Microbulbifer sp. GL-2 TaxID=2591606 RepID=UPI001161DF69|nr:hypothetical protein [Microbulbifer sp. GL-2]BBM02126.1 hypothetical protein GL2_22000 [Microbulbifer sp. GL-2]
MNKKLIRRGLIASGLINIGAVLILSRGFTNTAINEADPVVMSNFGLLMIMVWGLAFLGASTIPSNIKWLAGAFAVEKLVYTITWIRWISENSLTQIYATDIFAGVFYSVYGLNDFLFMCFFVWVYLYYSKTKNN